MPDARLTELLQADGPFVTVYLPTPSDRPQAGQELTTRWKNVRRALAAEGADDETLRAVDAALDVDTEAVVAAPSGDPGNASGTGNRPSENVAPALDDAADHTGGDGLVVVAAGGRVLLAEPVPAVRDEGEGRLGLLPWLVPLLRSQQDAVPYLVVLADRRGADISGYGPDVEVDRSVDAVNQGPVVERVKAGGWSQRRYQQRAIEAWEENAREVADEVAHLARAIGAQLIAVGGDVHAVRLVTDALPPEAARLVRQLEHGTRAAGGDASPVDDEVRRLVRTVAAERQTAVIRTFKEEAGQRDLAATGPARVIEALQTGMVSDLLLAEDGTADRTAWFGPEPTHLAIDEADLAAMGVEHPSSGPLEDVLVRAALGTGAAVHVVPAAVVDGGVGAVLRAVTTPRAG